ncbi:lipopolysaccharide biosynthesis protein [Fusobacterium mortiferum]|uniref:lipopolysaccharide biosynthesis protein n=2 Tax=Fusobacterium TaxID=848 RepID=UPI001F2F8396|nr:lipopolysaccharide biosynthesis protein [Fusobacterium mortiferum]MCF2628528.1 lipopolysaccharide biosynthesis protein [Fusobacterium mortiferum]
MSSNLRTKIFSSLIWKFLERGGTQGIQFILQMVLARLLTPKDYGTVALITIFIAISTVFVQSGFNTALIQKKDIDEEDISSVFYVSLFIAAIMYIILYFFAPTIANFYKILELTSIIRVMGLVLFLNSFNSIQNAIVSRNMEFKRLFYSSLGAIIISGILGIVLAYKGFGVWALAYQQLMNQFSICIILWFIVKWRPKLLFSIKKVKKLFSFGGKLLCSSLIDTIYRELVNLIVGKVYSPAMLGYYNRGDQFPKVIVSNFNGSIQSVIFPALASVQHDKVRVKEIMRRAIMMSSYIVFPAMVGLIVVSEPMIRLVLTERWLPCVPYLRVFCLSYALWPIHTANLQAINAIGRSDIFLKLEIIKKIIGVSIIIVTSRYSPYIMAIGTVFSGIISSFINSYPNKKLLNYSYLEQMKDILPSLFISIIMGIIIYLIQLLVYRDILTIILQVILGGILYVMLSYIFKNKSFFYLVNILKSKVGRIE